MTQAAPNPDHTALLGLLSRIATQIADHPVDETLATFLNTTYPLGGPDFTALQTLSAACAEDGSVKMREAGGIHFGRVTKPGTQTRHFSVDLVRMNRVQGPHHIHTSGEIGAILPLEGAVEFDGFKPGWYVYPAGSDHHPTVTNGEAYVLYFLPDGAIEFTGRAPA